MTKADKQPTSTVSLVTGALAADAVCILAFVAIGARNHDSGGGLTGVLGIGVPFWIALAATAVVPDVRRNPLGRSALVTVWATTVFGGVLLRNLVFGDGTAPTFIAVTALFLGATTAGWRAALGRLRPRSAG